MNISRRCFTILEVMIAIVLLTIASGVVGLRMHKAVQRKKFHSELERLRARFTVSQRMAVAMQADWKGILRKDEEGWAFETSCEEVAGKKLSPLRLEKMEIVFNRKQFRELTFDFFASGHTLPDGIFVFTKDSQKMVWKTSDLFLKDSGSLNSQN